MKKYIPLALVVLTALSLSAFGEVRTWTQSATGKKLEGEFVRMKDDKTAIIKFGTGAAREVPVTILSEEDQKFLAEQSGDMKPDEAAPAPDDAAKTDEPATPAKKGALPEAETTVVLSGVHMCCRDCEELAEKSAENEKLNFADPSAIKIVPSKKDDTITVTAPNGKEAMMALRGLTEAGFYGKSDHDVVKINEVKDDPFVSDIMTVKYIKVCCSKSERALKKAAESVDGVEEVEIKEGASSFKITGKGFKPTAVMQALQAIGYGGRG